jgi:flagellar motor switch protein FliG
MEEVTEEDSVYDRYNRMSRHQKLGLLMIALGPEASATLLKRFDSKD